MQTPDGRCEIGVRIDVERGDVRRFLVQLQLARSRYGPGDREVARIDHNPGSVHGHDVFAEGIHVDVVVPEGVEATLFPRGGEHVRQDLGIVIDLASQYFTAHWNYFVRVSRGEVSPEDPPRWP